MASGESEAADARDEGQLTRQDVAVLLRSLRFARESVADPIGRRALERLESKLRTLLLPRSRAC